MRKVDLIKNLLILVCLNVSFLNHMLAQEIQSTFFYEGNKGLAPQCCLYKIDNKTRNELKSGFLAFGYNKTHKTGAFTIEIAPGKHTFEIILNDKGVTSKPGRIVARKLTIDMKPEYEYQMERNDFDLKIVCKSNKAENVDYTIEDIPAFTVPAGEFATLVYVPDKKADVNPFITRIDDGVTPDLGDISGTCNYSLPVDFKYFSGLNGELNLKIPAGSHKIEYLFLGANVYDGLVNVTTCNFEAGKKYLIVLEEKKVKGGINYSIRFVEN